MAELEIRSPMQVPAPHDSDAPSRNSHNHDASYATSGHNHDASYAASGHNHDASYAAASHNHAASAITSGTIATARLGSGTADATTFLRGDQTWATPAGGGGSVAPRTASASTTYSADGTAAGDIQLTCTGNVTITPTGTPDGRVMTIECLASGAQRTVSVASGVALTTGVLTRSLTVPSGQIGVFLLRYTDLPTTATWYLAAAFVVG